jgi:hypothetical protein
MEIVIEKLVGCGSNENRKRETFVQINFLRGCGVR